MKKLNRHTGRHAGGVMAAAGCLLALSGCGEGTELSQTGEALSASGEATYAADAQILREKVFASSSPWVMIDLRDNRQFRFVQYRLARAGLTPASSPDIFEALSESRARAVTARGALEMPEGHTHLIANLLVDSNDSSRISSDAYTTTRGGAEYSYLDVTIFDKQGAMISDTVIEEQFYEGTDVVARTSGKLTGDSATTGYVMADSMACNNASGLFECTFSAVEANTKRHGKLMAPFDQELPGVPLDGMITVCLNRSWLYDAYDCEYKMDATGGNIRFPLKGEIDFGANIQKIRKAFVELSLANNGGSCQPKLDLLSYIKPDAGNASKVAWDIPVADFGRNCFSHQADVNFNLGVEVDINLNGTLVSGFGTISSQAENGGAVIPEFQFASSCLAAGTQVRLADGSLTAVERVGQDSQVLAGRDGTVLSVTDLSLGVEDLPMVRLEDSFGNSLLLTEGHPVVTSLGLRRADELQLGDDVMTEQGPALLVRVEREPYGGTVHNLKLGTDTERRLVGDDETTFFANGILVGDGRLQAEIEFGEGASFDLIKYPQRRFYRDYMNRQAGRR